jgi:hypothetical protein
MNAGSEDPLANMDNPTQFQPNSTQRRKGATPQRGKPQPKLELTTDYTDGTDKRNPCDP